MLLPLPTELFKRFYAPVTWALILLNYMTFLWTNQTNVQIEESLKEVIGSERYVQSQGLIYSQYIKMYTDRYSVHMNKLAELALRGERVKVMSRLAINDLGFLKNGPKHDYTGDQVAIAEWKVQFSKFLDLRERTPASTMGLSSNHSGLVNWISYQFSHSGFLHFGGNMMFLLLFGTLLEPLIGGLSIVIVYLLSGFFAALFFLLDSGNLTVPLIGASGSVSGLMALYSAIYWNRSVRFFYFLFVPKIEYLGYIYLPGWVLLLIWGASDLAGFLGSMKELGGVAYGAHLGGEFAGLSVGFLFWLIRKFVGRPLPNDSPGEPPIGTHVSLAEIYQSKRVVRNNQLSHFKN